MGRARLTRIDAVREMAAAVDAFRNEAIAALEGLDMDIRRALEWIHGDRREHWNGEVRRGWDRITQARIQLQQARTVRRVGDHEPACPDEKKALDRAKRRLETAQAKVEAVRQLCPRDRRGRERLSRRKDAAGKLAGIGGPQGDRRAAADDGQSGYLCGHAGAQRRGGERPAAAGRRASYEYSVLSTQYARGAIANRCEHGAQY